MKVLLISTTASPVPPPRYGGIERIVYELSRGLADLGHEVTLVAARGSKPPDSVGKILTTEPGAIWREEVAYPVYRRELREHDVVCDHSILKVAARDFLPDDAIKYVPVCHTLDLPAIRLSKPRLVGVSHSHAAFMSRRYGYTFRAIPNGIPLDDDAPMPGIKEKNGFLFLGRLTPEKGARDAIRFCKILDARLTIVEGTGTERLLMRIARATARVGLPVDYLAKMFYRGPYGISYLLRAARESRMPNCVYRRNVSNEEKARLLSHAAALLLPLHYEEPFGLMAVEAMALGTPVVAYARGAMQEIIEDGKSGILVEPGNERLFLEAMKNVEGIDPQACRRRVKERFSASRMVRDYENLFKEVAEGASW